jgi:hypothetical protein
MQRDAASMEAVVLELVGRGAFLQLLLFLGLFGFDLAFDSGLRVQREGGFSLHLFGA